MDDRPRHVDPHNSPLGHTFAPESLERELRAIYGAVAWPGKRPGFLVVVGMTKSPPQDSSDLILLDESESADTRTLIRWSGVMRQKYRPGKGEGGPTWKERWIGRRNTGVDRFVREMNGEANADFCLSSTPIFDMENPYGYILPTLRHLLTPDARRLFLKSSKVLEYLAGIKEDEIPDMRWGDLPAIEAVGLAVAELREHGGDVEHDAAYYRRLAAKYSGPSWR